jgi:hypothetical protein
MDYICAITGSLSDNDAQLTETGPLGWVKITIERQIPNPEYMQLQAYKNMIAEQQFLAVRDQLPEGDAQAEAEVRIGIGFGVRAQFAPLEAEIEEFTTQYEEVYISPPEEDEDVLMVLNEIREALGLYDGQESSEAEAIAAVPEEEAAPSAAEEGGEG